MPDITPLDPARIIGALHKHEVRFVLIGALAARLHGFPRLTADADITPDDSRPNVEKLAKALRELDARIFTEAIPEGLEFDCSAAMLRRAQMWNLVTSAGRVDIAFRPAGTGGYDDLAANAEKFEAFGVKFLAASLADIIRSKEAAGRPKDREDVAIMRAMQKRSTRAKGQ
ncbi:MAG: hypothetical protein H0U59_01800 [Gemmatimonadaceae bacterium]|nr:hypothetical protein [Gemmatimonadaceae bacterium]